MNVSTHRDVGGELRAGRDDGARAEHDQRAQGRERVHERRRLMPHPEDVGTDELSECEIAMRSFDTDDQLVARQSEHVLA